MGWISNFSKSFVNLEYIFRKMPSKVGITLRKDLKLDLLQLEILISDEDVIDMQPVAKDIKFLNQVASKKTLQCQRNIRNYSFFHQSYLSSFYKKSFLHICLDILNRKIF